MEVSHIRYHPLIRGARGVRDVERRITDKRGVILPLVALALVALLAVVGLTADVGLLAIAAQQAQSIADAAALGGGIELPDYDSATDVALSLVETNNESATGLPATCSPDDGDIAFWGPGDDIPDFGSLGTAAWSIRVTVHVPVSYVFVRVLGLEGASITRSATVVRMPVGGVPITPMWINYQTDYQYGEVQELLMASGPHYENIPGSFGWLEPPSGQSSDFLELLRRYDLTHEQVVSNYASVDDICTAYTGLSVGQWRQALDTAPDGLARMQRAMWEPWTGDSFDDFHDTNPRIMIVPMCEYLGGTGTGAQFQVLAFGAFYLESVNSKKTPYSLTGRFIEYHMPGAGGDALAPETGLWTVKMVQ